MDDLIQTPQIFILEFTVFAVYGKTAADYPDFYSDMFVP